MHECGNLIEHEGEARGLYAVTARGHYPYTTGRGGLTGLYPTVVLQKPYRSKDTDSRYTAYYLMNIHAGQ